MTGKPWPPYPKDPELLHQSQILGQEIGVKKERGMRRIDDGQKQQNLRSSCSGDDQVWSVSGILTIF
jgi:hypothetical protein